MGKINVLSFEVANLIAAGEVVDRPASCIKELVENSIDSGATRITVELQRGGVLYMRVSDNGCGIEKDDLPLAVRRHATSKIRSADDLAAIMTLGFRGEALAAICAVADVRIISKVRGAEYGAQIEVNSGRVGPVSERGASEGTTVIVENLFANVPARLKFLKRDQTEGAAAVSAAEKIAMSHPEIAFRIITDGTVRLETPGDGRLSTAVRAVYGRDFASKLIPVEYCSGPVRVSGFVTAPEAPRATRSYQNFFINGRFVRTRTASAALEQAYVSYIPPDRFPGCVLRLELQPSAVDVNVHPSKLEVKFSDERPVFDAVYAAVRDALMSDTVRPGMGDRPGSAAESGGSQPDGAIRPASSAASPPAAPAAVARSGDSFFMRVDARDASAAYRDVMKRATGASLRPSVSGAFVPVTDHADRSEYAPKQLDIADAAVSAQTPEQLPSGGAEGLSWRIVGELFNTYIVYEEGDTVTVADKHAAHERIIFEKLRRGLSGLDRPQVLLAVPIELDMTAADAAAVEDCRDSIEKTGFSFSVSGTSVSVTAIPDGIPAGAVGDMFQCFAEAAPGGGGSVELAGSAVFEKALFTASCKAAVKAGRVYPEGYSSWLVAEMHRYPEATCCPHGRPVAFTFKKSEFDRRFGRI